MQVAIMVEQALAPVPGGTGRYCVELARALAERAADGDTVTGWVAWHRDSAAAEIPGVAGPRSLPLARRPLTVAWERQVGPTPRDADVVHAPTLLVPPRRDRPLVVTIHDAVPWSHPETLTPRGVVWHRRMAAYAARTADRVVVPTHAVADELSDRLHLGDRAVVIGEGASRALTLPPDAAERAAALDLPDRFVLSLATLEPRKGLDVLLDALAEPAAPDLPLVVVGQPGWGGVDPVAAAARAGVSEARIRPLGRIPDADLAVVLDRATVLAVPSRSEGFGLPVVEGMAAGTPVVTSDIPPLVEVGGTATLTVPAGDSAALAEALRTVVEDAGLAARMVAAGRVRAAEYSWSAAAEKVWRIYADLA